MHFVLRILRPSPGQGCAAMGQPDVWAALLWRCHRLSAGCSATLARENFMFCLQGRKAGFHAAKAKGGYNSISNTPVRSEARLYTLSVFLDSRLENGIRGGVEVVTEPWLPKAEWLDRQRTAA